MLKLKRLCLMMFACLLQLAAWSQQNITDKVEEKGGFMRSEGKIYVVVAVVLTIVCGLIIYVARLDRKITKLEKGNL